MVDSEMVLTGQTLAYTSYCIVIILLVGWFSLKVTGKGEAIPVKPKLFYAFVIFLVCVNFHKRIFAYAEKRVIQEFNQCE